MKKIDRIISESINMLLMEAMALGDVYNTWYSDIDEDIFKQIVSADPTSGPNKVGKYSKWLLKLYKTNNLKLEDLYKATEYLNYFIKFNNRIEVKDINRYKSLPELYNAIRGFMENPEQATSNSDEARQIKKSEAKKVYEDNEWVVIVPLTHRAACYYGKGTQWCTASKDNDDYFNQYNSQGPLYININKQSGKKYQFHFESSQFMDETDSPIVEYCYGEIEGNTIAEELEFNDSICKFYINTVGDNATKLFRVVEDYTNVAEDERVVIYRNKLDDLYEIESPYVYDIKTSNYRLINNCIAYVNKENKWSLISGKGELLNDIVSDSIPEPIIETENELIIFKTILNNICSFSVVKNVEDGYISRHDWNNFYSVNVNEIYSIHTFNDGYSLAFVVFKNNGTADLVNTNEDFNVYEDLTSIDGKWFDEIQGEKCLIFNYGGDNYYYDVNDETIVELDEEYGYDEEDDDDYDFDDDDDRINENVNKNIIKLSKTDIKNLIKESIKHILNNKL